VHARLCHRIGQITEEDRLCLARAHQRDVLSSQGLPIDGDLIGKALCRGLEGQSSRVAIDGQQQQIRRRQRSGIGLVIKLDGQIRLLAGLLAREDRRVASVVGVVFVNRESERDSRRHGMDHVGGNLPMIRTVPRGRRGLVNQRERVSARHRGESGAWIAPPVDTLNSCRQPVDRISSQGVAIVDIDTAEIVSADA
jgi:hypothetical protein